MKILRFLLVLFVLASTSSFAADKSARMDSTALADPTIMGDFIEAATVSSGVPVGTVIVWPNANNPEDAENWLECNGQAISQSVYPELFAVIGGNVPNYSGMFLRGNGSQSHVQNNGTLVGNTSTTHAAGALGQVQGDAIRNIYGHVGTVDFRGNASETTQSGPLYRGSFGNSSGDGGRTSSYIYFNAARAVPTALENRPVNVAVRYLIRAKA